MIGKTQAISILTNNIRDHAIRVGPHTAASEILVELVYQGNALLNTLCMSMEGGLPVMRDCQSFYTPAVDGWGPGPLPPLVKPPRYHIECNSQVHL